MVGALQPGAGPPPASTPVGPPHSLAHDCDSHCVTSAEAPLHDACDASCWHIGELAAVGSNVPLPQTHETYAEQSLSNDASCDAQLVSRHETHAVLLPEVARHDANDPPPLLLPLPPLTPPLLPLPPLTPLLLPTLLEPHWVSQAEHEALPSFWTQDRHADEMVQPLWQAVSVGAHAHKHPK
jgi:hypothetical protein